MAEKDEKIKNINYNVYMTWGFLKVFHTLIFISVSLIKTNNSSKQKISFLFFYFLPSLQKSKLLNVTCNV